MHLKCVLLLQELISDELKLSPVELNRLIHGAAAVTSCTCVENGSFRTGPNSRNLQSSKKVTLTLSR